MFSRKIRIFGKSIPLTVIVAAVVVFAAAAAWVWNQQIGATVNTAPGVNIVYYGEVICELTANPGGGATISPLSNNPPACQVDNARPGVSFTVLSTVDNLSTTDTICAGPLVTDDLPDYVTVVEIMAEDVVNPDSQAGQKWEFTLGDTLPSDATVSFSAYKPWGMEYCE